MRKTVAKRILVSLITLVMVSVCVLPMVIKNANVAGAAENVAGGDEEYKDNLKLRKYISDELPDENGYYTLNFSAQTKNLQTIEGEEQNIVLVIDSSLSMACDISSDVESKNMGYTYENTRWNIMYNSIDAFLQKFFEANANSKVSLVSYNKDANVKVTESSKKSDVLDALKEIYSKDMFEESRKESESDIDLDDMKNKGGLGSGTNVQGGINAASELLGENKSGNAVILFTDGVANKYSGSSLKYEYTGTLEKVSVVNNGYYVNGTKYSGNTNELLGSYYANIAGQKLSSEGVDIYTVALMRNVDDNVKVSMGAANESYEYVEVSTTTDKKGKTTVTGKTEFTTTDSGYAKEFFLADNADSLNESVNKITTTITPVIFEDASVIDTLDKHFKLAEGQENVTDNGDGTFTVKYDKAVSSTEQVISVKIKAVDGYAGSSYTNDGCVFNATIGGNAYTQKYEQTPAAIILPTAKDDEYSVDRDSKLEVSIPVTDNDGNEYVNNNGRNVTIKAVKVSDTANGKVAFNNDGTFTYIPDAGYTGADSFDYDVVLVVDGNEYTAHAKVTINVNPAKTPETPSEPEVPSKPENPSEPEVPSQPEIPSESVTVPASGEVAADEEVVTKGNTQSQITGSGEVAADEDVVVPEVAADESTVTTGDSSHVMLYVIIMIVVAGIAAATIIVRHKKETK